MQIQQLLLTLEQELFSIHDSLFSGTATKEELMRIKEDLGNYAYMLKVLKEESEIIAKIIKLLQALFHTSSLLILCFIILGILNIPVGMGLFIMLNYFGYKTKKAYVEEKKEIDEKILKLTQDVKYKQEITKKKLERLNTFILHQKEFRPSQEFYQLNTKTKDLTLIRELKPKNRQ